MYYYDCTLEAVALPALTHHLDRAGQIETYQNLHDWDFQTLQEYEFDDLYRPCLDVGQLPGQFSASDKVVKV